MITEAKTCGVSGKFCDEAGVEGHADPFQQRDGGHDAAAVFAP